jgi:hypothetical protein
MKSSVRPVLAAAVAFALLGLAPLAMSPAYALPPPIQEVHLNSSNVQVVHNPSPNTDVLNMSLNVTNNGDISGSCNGGLNDFLESGFVVGVSHFSCAAILSGAPDFLAILTYVEHDIGSSSYGTNFGPNIVGTVASKIVALTTPPNTCGTWSINLQATGQDLSGITSPPVALFFFDADSDAGSNFLNAACFDVNANIGNGITKPHHGVHRIRR